MALITRVTEGQLQEQDIWFGVGSAGIDPDDHLFRRLTTARRELPNIVQQRMLRLAWQMYESNPLAHGMIESMKDHVVGDGFRVEAESDVVRAVLDKHWDDWQNNWPLKQHDRVRELSIYGEQFYVVSVNKVNGHVRLASIDPINIRHVVLNPENPEEVLGVVLNAGGGDGIAYRNVHPQEDPTKPHLGKLVGAEAGETLSVPRGKEWRVEGTCMFFAVNKVSSASRGRSDLLSSLDWLDVYDQILMNGADRTLLMSAFIWDVTLKGASPARVQEWLKAYGRAPKPGTVRAHSEKEEWKEVSPGLHSSGLELANLQKMIKAQGLSSNVLPPTWFGDQDANRATALEMGSPSLKHLAARQLYVVNMTRTILRFQLDQAFIADERLEAEWRKEMEIDPKDEDATPTFSVVAPEMSPRDMSRGATSMQAVANALILALDKGIIDEHEAQNVFAIVASQVGADIELDAMRDRMAEEATTAPPMEALEEALRLVAASGGNNGA